MVPNQRNNCLEAFYCAMNRAWICAPENRLKSCNRKKLKAEPKSTEEHVVLAEKNCSTVDLWSEDVWLSWDICEPSLWEPCSFKRRCHSWEMLSATSSAATNSKSSCKFYVWVRNNDKAPTWSCERIKWNPPHTPNCGASVVLNMMPGANIPSRY